MWHVKQVTNVPEKCIFLNFYLNKLLEQLCFCFFMINFIKGPAPQKTGPELVKARPADLWLHCLHCHKTLITKFTGL